MKQGKFYTKLVLWIFLAAVVCYFGYYVFSAIYAPLTTVTAIEYEAGSGAYTTGYVVRQESVVKSQYEITTLTISEGERVAKGQIIATGYQNEDAQDRQQEIHTLEHQLEQLEFADSYSADTADQAVLDGEIQTRLENLARYVARRDMNAFDDSSAAVKGLILRRTSTQEQNEAMTQRIEALKNQVAQLKADAAQDTKTVAADSAGYFSGTVDGYEAVLTPERILEMNLDQLGRVTPREVTDDSLGKLISDSTWYYVTSVDDDLVQEVRVGDQVPVTFSSVFYDDLLMTVERIEEPDDGRCLLVLSCDLHMQAMTLLREQSADVVFTSYAGLRVPKGAIRVREDQQTGVYILEGRSAQWKNVRILHDNGESYVVELDKSSTDNLWPGDEIIVDAHDLYNGKVVR